jgi:hypothetical protein
VAAHRIARDRADSLEPRLHRGRAEEQLAHGAQLGLDVPHPPNDLAHHRFGEVERHAARPDEAATEPVPRDEHEQVQELAAQPAEVRGAGLVRHIPRQRAQVPHVIGKPLQLERDAADALRPRALLTARQRFDRATVRARVRDHRVPRDGLRHQHRALSRETLEQSLDAAMLVPEHDLEKEHLLAVRLEPEVTRLDDACVHRSHRDFVHLLALHAVERIRCSIVRLEVPTGRRMVGRMTPDSLEPRMTLGNHAALLGQLALEPRRLRTGRCERWVACAGHGRERGQLAALVVGENRQHSKPAVIFGHPEERDDPPLRGDRLDDGRAKVVDA